MGRCFPRKGPGGPFRGVGKPSVIRGTETHTVHGPVAVETHAVSGAVTGRTASPHTCVGADAGPIAFTIAHCRSGAGAGTGAHAAHCTGTATGPTTGCTGTATGPTTGCTGTAASGTAGTSGAATTAGTASAPGAPAAGEGHGAQRHPGAFSAGIDGVHTRCVADPVARQGGLKQRSAVCYRAPGRNAQRGCCHNNKSDFAESGKHFFPFT